MLTVEHGHYHIFFHIYYFSNTKKLHSKQTRYEAIRLIKQKETVPEKAFAYANQIFQEYDGSCTIAIRCITVKTNLLITQFTAHFTTDADLMTAGHIMCSTGSKI